MLPMGWWAGRASSARTSSSDRSRTKRPSPSDAMWRAEPSESDIYRRCCFPDHVRTPQTWHPAWGLHHRGDCPARAPGRREVRGGQRIRLRFVRPRERPPRQRCRPTRVGEECAWHQDRRALPRATGQSRQGDRPHNRRVGPAVPGDHRQGRGEDIRSKRRPGFRCRPSRTTAPAHSISRPSVSARWL